MIESSETRIGPITRALSARLAVLIVDQSKDTAENITRELERSGYAVSAEYVADAAQVGGALDKTSFDIVITNVDSPVIQALRERQLETPVVVITDRGDDVTNLEAIAAGAEDVLKREDLYRLPYVVGRILQHAQIRQDQSAMLSTGKIYLTRKHYTLRSALIAAVAALLIVEAVPGGFILKSIATVSLGILATIYVLLPIERLRKIAAELSLGSIDREVPKGPGPVGDIASGLDTLRKRLKKSVLARQSDLAQRLRAEEALRQVHLRLRTQIDATQSRARQFTLLAEMGALLQACATREETGLIIERFTSELFPGMQAAVHLDMSTADCWALRRGQTHIASASAGASELRCAHVPAGADSGTLCIPLMAQGTAIGILHLRHADFAAIPQALAEAVTEQISLCLANLMLREELRDLTITDPLTGLYNRRFVAESLSREIQRAERLRSAIGLIAIDIDHFKRINDRFGHDGGDAALEAIAVLLREHVRGGDIACRLGGEEFAVILPGATEQATRERAEKLRQAVMQLRIPHAPHELPQISISCGVALFPDHATTAAGLLKAGDQALYRAKEAGRNRVASAAA